MVPHDHSEMLLLYLLATKIPPGAENRMYRQILSPQPGISKSCLTVIAVLAEL